MYSFSFEYYCCINYIAYITLHNIDGWPRVGTNYEYRLNRTIVIDTKKRLNHRNGVEFQNLP